MKFGFARQSEVGKGKNNGAIQAAGLYLQTQSARGLAPWNCCLYYRGLAQSKTLREVQGRRVLAIAFGLRWPSIACRGEYKLEAGEFTPTAEIGRGMIGKGMVLFHCRSFPCPSSHSHRDNSFPASSKHISLIPSGSPLHAAFAVAWLHTKSGVAVVLCHRTKRFRFELWTSAS